MPEAANIAAQITPHIIVIEDNPADVYLIREAIRATGLSAEITHYDDGLAAIRYLKEGHVAPELILLDLNMPRRDGIEILSDIRDMTWLAGVPVGILTSSEAPKDRANALRGGAQRYIVKPQNLRDFLGGIGLAVRELLKADDPIAYPVTP